MSIDPSIQTILDSCKKTKFKGIYENSVPEINKSKPFLFMIIGPTGSGKSILIDTLEENSFVKVKTATTRPHRSNEDSNEYVWITDEKSNEESLEDFKNRIQEKYNLLETNIHAENIYGAPREELSKALKAGRAVIGIENHGAREVKRKFSESANIITFFVLPDSFEELRKRINTSRNDIEERLEIAKQEIQESKDITNYYIHNTELHIYTLDEIAPLAMTKRNLLEFCKDIAGLDF